ncbi:Lymphoid-specific helicase [Lachnellula subtilissima]|uniref:Lymphoid-specific helicase n=1 Tax=Lachnellula subtilissima TaxID=602034 RepID=A0A8H8U650_9HELO|nr:Lymphoid-specific helicase [Lachnellula subtilissima]
MASPSSSQAETRSQTPQSEPSTTPASSPPPAEENFEDELNPDFLLTKEEKAMLEEEQKVKAETDKREEQRKKRVLKKTGPLTRDERDTKATELNELLAKSEVFSKILTGKTKALGRMGTTMDGTSAAIGEHHLEMTKQPKTMIGGTMRDYQLEGLTWMAEIALQGMSGILADEMGLGKTIQTISLIAHLREMEFYGPFLIVAPLSTLSNWIEEFEKWVPGLPVILYHGTKPHRTSIFKSEMEKNVDKSKRVNKRFPVVCTSPEMILKDENNFTKIKWEIIMIDEGHRMKNSNSKLFQVLKSFYSATRFLITGTPLQNNLKELWSLLNFLLPNIFKDWTQFEAWFDFSDLQDERGTEEFIQDTMKQELVKKMHVILQPLLLRRVKADVEHMLPKKREYILYAPMTKEQTDLYNTIGDKTADLRKYLEDKVIQRLTEAAVSPQGSRKASPTPISKKNRSIKTEKAASKDLLTSPVTLRFRDNGASDIKPVPKNAFEKMMANKSFVKPRGRPTGSLKRNSLDDLATSESKSVKSSRNSTPAGSIRSRQSKAKKTYAEAHSSDEDDLSDDEFEQKLADELAVKEEEEAKAGGQEVDERANIVDLARKEISGKKLGNPLMQLRLACNSPHNFYNVWSLDSGLEVDETLVTSSGKMLLLDRLLPSLFDRGSKVLIFSQFKTSLDLLEDYARDLRGYNVCRLDGSVAQDDRRKQIKEFNENPEFKLFLLSTRAGGQGINLATADTVILFDSDWNPQQDLQAQDRAHRIGQTKPVVIFRLATKGTVEETLLKSAEGKRRLEKAVIKKGGFKTMGQKMDNEGGMSEADWKTLLLKDGQVYKTSGGDEVLTDQDLDVLCDRSDEAYANAAKGLGNAGGYEIVETKAGGMMIDLASKS